MVGLIDNISAIALPDRLRRKTINIAFFRSALTPAAAAATCVEPLRDTIAPSEGGAICARAGLDGQSCSPGKLFGYRALGMGSAAAIFCPIGMICRSDALVRPATVVFWLQLGISDHGPQQWRCGIKMGWKDHEEARNHIAPAWRQAEV